MDTVLYYEGEVNGSVLDFMPILYLSVSNQRIQSFLYGKEILLQHQTQSMINRKM